VCPTAGNENRRGGAHRSLRGSALYVSCVRGGSCKRSKGWTGEARGKEKAERRKRPGPGGMAARPPLPDGAGEGVGEVGLNRLRAKRNRSPPQGRRKGHNVRRTFEETTPTEDKTVTGTNGHTPGNGGSGNPRPKWKQEGPRRGEKGGEQPGQEKRHFNEDHQSTR